jgi:hypothetical protein
LGRGPLELKIKNNKIKRLRLPDDAPITIYLMGTGRGGGPFALKIKKKNKKKGIAPRRVRTDYFYSYGHSSGRGAAGAKN